MNHCSEWGISTLASPYDIHYARTCAGLCRVIVQLNRVALFSNYTKALALFSRNVPETREREKKEGGGCSKLHLITFTRWTYIKLCAAEQTALSFFRWMATVIQLIIKFATIRGVCWGHWVQWLRGGGWGGEQGEREREVLHLSRPLDTTRMCAEFLLLHDCTACCLARPFQWSTVARKKYDCPVLSVSTDMH